MENHAAFTVKPLQEYLQRGNAVFLYVLLGLYFIAFLLAALTAPLPMEWWLDNIVVIAFWLAAAIYFRTVSMSWFSVLAILCFMSIHLVGAYYVYENVPVGEWMKGWFGLQRNHYDRVAHFAFGLCFVIPIIEALYARYPQLAKWLLVTFPLAAIIALSAVYEILEAIVAQLVEPELGSAFLGSQGDQWDAQADILVAILGAGLGLCILFYAKSNALRRTGL